MTFKKYDDFFEVALIGKNIHDYRIDGFEKIVQEQHCIVFRSAIECYSVKLLNTIHHTFFEAKTKAGSVTIAK